jgi:coiled-coil and C2 domain-containing protein 2A
LLLGGTGLFITLKKLNQKLWKAVKSIEFLFKQSTNNFYSHRTLGLTFIKWLQPKRPLRPTRKERKKVTLQNLAGQEVKIIVNVIHAFEVPVRKDVDTVGGGQQDLRFSIVPVRPFVEVSFQGVRVRTTTAEGANPTWNQDLQLPLK